MKSFDEFFRRNLLGDANKIEIVWSGKIITRRTKHRKVIVTIVNDASDDEQASKVGGIQAKSFIKFSGLERKVSLNKSTTHMKPNSLTHKPPSCGNDTPVVEPLETDDL